VLLPNHQQHHLKVLDSKVLRMLDSKFLCMVAHQILCKFLVHGFLHMLQDSKVQHILLQHLASLCQLVLLQEKVLHHLQMKDSKVPHLVMHQLLMWMTFRAVWTISQKQLGVVMLLDSNGPVDRDGPQDSNGPNLWIGAYTENGATIQVGLQAGPEGGSRGSCCRR
jgi:hypothetical protein